MRTIDCPLSIVGFEGVIALAMTAGLTVTVSPAEQMDAGVFAESVSLYEYVEVVVGDTENVDPLADGIGVEQVPSEYHA